LRVLVRRRAEGGSRRPAPSGDGSHLDVPFGEAVGASDGARRA
jgi:hypothetical protein